MGIGYQRRDEEIIDYQLWQLKGIKRPIRGPQQENLVSDQYGACIGAAQTFGCYVEQPFPVLLSESINIPILNFGVAGAGPSFFIRNNSFLRYVNDGRFAVVQVMSGRSVSNSLFKSNGGEMLTRQKDGVTKGAQPMYQDLLDTKNMELIMRVHEETKQAWIEETIVLLNAIRVPKVLLWFSKRNPSYQPGFEKVIDFFGAFPQLVDKPMLDAVKPYSDYYVEHVSDEGLPQKLFSRYTGEPTSIQMRKDLSGKEKEFNNYYPSPEMHKGVSEKLIQLIEGAFH